MIKNMDNFLAVENECLYQKNNYNLLKSKKFLKKDITIGKGGIICKKVKNWVAMNVRSPR